MYAVTCVSFPTWPYVDLTVNRIPVASVSNLKSLFDPSTTSTEELINMYLMDTATFGQRIRSLSTSPVDIRRIKFPIYFDFLENIELIPQFSKSHFRSTSRPQLIGWYLSQAVWFAGQVTCVSSGRDQAATLLSIAIRLLMGKKPKAGIPSDLLAGGALSEAVIVLVLMHRLLHLPPHLGRSATVAELMDMSGEDVVGQLVNGSKNTGELKQILTELSSTGTHESVSEFLAAVSAEFPLLKLTLLADLALWSADDLLVRWFTKALSAPALTKRAKSYQRTLFGKAVEVAHPGVITRVDALTRLVLALVYSSPDIGLDKHTMSVYEGLYQLLPAADGVSGSSPEWTSLMSRSDEFESHLSIADSILTFFQFQRISFNWLASAPTWSEERKLLVLSSIVKAGFQQWLLPGPIGEYVLTGKGTEFWWTHLVDRIHQLNSHLFRIPNVDDLVFEQVFHFAVVNEFGSNPFQHVENEVVFGILKRISSQADSAAVVRIVREFLFCSDWVSINNIDEVRKFLLASVQPDLIRGQIHTIDCYEAVYGLLFSTATSAEMSSKGKNLINIIQSAIDDKDRRRRAELVALSMHSQEFSLLTNLTVLEEMVRSDKVGLFERMFVFNMYAFLQTSKIQQLCRLMGVREGPNPEWIQVLHFAAIAYLETEEVEGATSIINRLVNELKDPDVWRLVIHLRRTSSDVASSLVNSAITLCPDSQLDSLLRELNTRKPTDVAKIKEANYLHQFPNLSDPADVDAYLTSLGGAASEVSMEMAEMVAGMPSLIQGEGVYPLIDSVRKASAVGCR